jgi:hypothetical protein
MLYSSNPQFGSTAPADACCSELSAWLRPADQNGCT